MSYPYKLKNYVLLHENDCINLQTGKVTILLKLLLCFTSGNDKGKASLVTQQSQTDKSRSKGDEIPPAHIAGNQLSKVPYHQVGPSTLPDALMHLVSSATKNSCHSCQTVLVSQRHCQAGFQASFPPRVIFWFSTKHPEPISVDKQARVAHITNGGMTLGESLGRPQVTLPVASASLCSTEILWSQEAAGASEDIGYQ